MNRRFALAAIGELLIDFTPLRTESGKAAYEQNPGGAPANVLVAAQRLGLSSALIAKVGDDMFGHFLKKTVDAEGVCTEALIISAEYPTTLAFVALDENGDRSFAFMRKNSADVMMSDSELPRELLSSCDILHFGSVSLTAEPSRSATFEAVRLAKAAGAVISYDPNYRAPLWESEADAVTLMREGLKYADIVKVSDNELELLTGESDHLAGAKALVRSGAEFAFVTLGADGCCYASADGSSGYITGFAVDAVDTTGAGDAFTGAVLTNLHKCAFSPSSNELEEIARYANAVGALSTTKRGAIPAMPTESEVSAFLDHTEK